MSDRPIRDILAECLRIERQGPIRPLWADWAKFADDECEQVRLRADHLMRLLEGHGLTIVQAGHVNQAAPAQSPEVYRYGVVGRKAERVVRRGAGEAWQIVSIENGVETVEQTFTADQASINGGLVLTDDPAAKAIPGLGRQLAALAEIYRLCAAAPERVE